MAKLRYPLFDANGVLLLAAGAEVTPRLQAVLDRRGVHLKLGVILEVVQGKPLGLEIPVRMDLCTIGRSSECEIRVASQVVSSEHCKLHKRARALCIIDLESTNGTLVNNEKISPMQERTLDDGDRVTVGETVFSVHSYWAVTVDSADDQKALDAWVLTGHSEDGVLLGDEPGGTVRMEHFKSVFKRPTE